MLDHLLVKFKVLQGGVKPCESLLTYEIHVRYSTRLNGNEFLPRNTILIQRSSEAEFV